MKDEKAESEEGTVDYQRNREGRRIKEVAEIHG